MGSKYGKYTGNQVETVLNMVGGEDVVDRALRGTVKISVEETMLIVVCEKLITVNYDCTVEDSIKAGGYNFVRPDIKNENFLSLEKGQREVSFAAFFFKNKISSEDVISEMRRAIPRYRPATLKELLAFEKDESNKDKQHTLVSLGSVLKKPGSLSSSSDLVVVYENRKDNDANEKEKRSLFMQYFEDGWLGGLYFLAVRVQ
jgi:hypothetical protein